MRWTPGGRSDNLEDRRGQGAGFGFGGGGGLRLGLGGFILLGILSLVFKTNFFSLLGGGGVATSPAVSRSDPGRDQREEPMVQFVSFVLDDAQNTWRQVLPKYGVPYQDAKLVLFRDAVNSGCGFAQASTGQAYYASKIS